MSKTRILILLSVALVVAIAFFALGRPEWAPVAEALPGCTLASLNGTFSFVASGVGPDAEPFGEIGTFTADGAGNIAGTAATLDNGVYSTETFTCTYSMSPECMFRGPCLGEGDVIPEVRLDGALADSRREAKLLLSGVPDGPGGPVVTGEAHKQ